MCLQLCHFGKSGSAILAAARIWVDRISAAMAVEISDDEAASRSAVVVAEELEPVTCTALVESEEPAGWEVSTCLLSRSRH